jgi:hypothetical protein
VAEEQDGLSKRERQKARRQARRQEELAQAKRARMTSGLIRGLAVAVVIGILGLLVGNWWLERREEAELVAAAEARLDELGCTDDALQPDQSAGHIQDPAQVPPEAIYTDRPVSSGPHLGAVAQSGVYDTLIDERLLVHNLEHGYVIAYYAEDAPAEEIAELKEFAEAELDDNPKLIVAPKIGEWSSDADFAFVAWRYRQMCEEFDPGVLLSFIRDHYGLAGIAPEKSVPAHTGGGALAPEGDTPLVFPPLTEESPHESAVSPAPPQGEAEPEDAEPEDAEPGDAEPTEE